MGSFIVQGPNPWFGVNLVSLVKVFFSAVSCSLGIALQDSGGCQVTSLEHFQIFTFFQNGRRRNRGKSNFWTRSARNLCDTSFKSNLNTRIPILTLFLCHDLILTPTGKMAAEIGGKCSFWTRPPRNLCDTSFKSNLTTRIPILTLFLCHDLILTPKGKMAAIRWLPKSVENVAFEPDHIETCVIPLLRVIWPQGFQFWHYFYVMTSFWPIKLKMAAIRLTKKILRFFFFIKNIPCG